jgi:hypothetical protein
MSLSSSASSGERPSARSPVKRENIPNIHRAFLEELNPKLFKFLIDYYLNRYPLNKPGDSLAGQAMLFSILLTVNTAQLPDGKNFLKCVKLLLKRVIRLDEGIIRMARSKYAKYAAAPSTSADIVKAYTLILNHNKRVGKSIAQEMTKSGVPPELSHMIHSYI